MNAHVSIDLLHCGFSHVHTWSVRRPRRPFWRMYWNRTAAGAMRLGRTRVELGPRRMVLVAPDTAFQATHETAMEHFHAHFTASQPYDAVTSLLLTIDLAAEETRAFVAFAALLERGEAPSPGDVAWLASRALAGLSRIPAERWPSPRRDERVVEAARAMESDLSRSWRNPDLARVAHMATNSFIRRFKTVMGTPPQAFLMERRLDRVRIMLEHTDLSIEAIAYECGFSSRSHLATAFAQRFNIPPGAYRRMTHAE